MKQRKLQSLFLFVTLAVLFVQLISITAEAGENAFYVSPDGNDKASGISPNSAFATLRRARDAVRELKKAKALPEGGVTVWIRSGEYYLDKDFELTTEDSGTAEATIVYCAMTGEQVSIVGGRQVSGWQKVRD
ncbi:MAG: hypothetical protein OEW48_10570, partial [Phycisphaerae bacterium]|nr:hypothetical protein [Phycisphaerae bacterium]